MTNDAHRPKRGVGEAFDAAHVAATEVTVEPVAFEVPLTGERAWDFVTGSGARAMLFGLDDHGVGTGPATLPRRTGARRRLSVPGRRSHRARNPG